MLNIKLAKLLVGTVCRNFRLVEGGTLILYLQPINTEASSALETKLWVDCAWRLCSKNGIIVGSLNEAHVALENLQQLKGQSLVSVSCDETTKDLRIGFTSGLFLESFSYSTQDEIWEIRRSDGYRLGIGPRLQPYEKEKEREE